MLPLNGIGKLAAFFCVLTTFTVANAREGWQKRLQFLERCSQVSKEREDRECYDTFRTLHPLTEAVSRACQNKGNPQGKYPFTIDETWDSAYESLEECTETCSEGCLYVVKEIRSRYSLYYAKYKAPQKSAPRSTTKRRDVPPEEANFVCIAVRGTSYNGNTFQENFDGFGLTLPEALHSACYRCGGNETKVFSGLTASYSCIIAACATADGRDKPKEEWDSLIPAKCTRSHNGVMDLRGVKPRIRNWRP